MSRQQMIISHEGNGRLPDSWFDGVNRKICPSPRAPKLDFRLLRRSMGVINQQQWSHPAAPISNFITSLSVEATTFFRF